MSKCLDCEFYKANEEDKASFCDNYCRKPMECVSQEELEEICNSCPIERLGVFPIK